MTNKKCVNTDGWKNAQQKHIKVWNDKRIANINAYELNPKKCTYCGVSMPYDKRTNKFCSHRCSAIIANHGYDRHRAVATKQRVCLQCGSSLMQKAYNAKCCSYECDSLRSRREALSKWELIGIHEIKFITDIGRMYYLDIRGGKCEECGWNKINPSTGKSPLNIEHINGDCTNNLPENIKVLCPSCHSLTPTYGSLNRGNSQRTNRRKQHGKASPHITTGRDNP